MPSLPLNPNQPTLATDLLDRAASLLGSEVARFRPTQALVAPGSTQPSFAPPGELGLQPFAPARALHANDLIGSLLASAQGEDLRRRGTDLLESILAALTRDAQNSTGADAQRVPLLSAGAPVHAGSSARATLRVTNEEGTPSNVTLYGTNFIADVGFEIPSLYMSISPRRASIAPGAEVAFEVQVAVPSQAPSGLYSGLIQALGSKYVKAVIMFEVL